MFHQNRLKNKKVSSKNDFCVKTSRRRGEWNARAEVVKVMTRIDLMLQHSQFCTNFDNNGVHFYRLFMKNAMNVVISSCVANCIQYFFISNLRDLSE